MKKIDAHFHVNFMGFSADRIVEYLNQKGIEKCWALTWEEKDPPIPSLYKHLSFEDVMDAHERHPQRIIPFYAPDPGSQDIQKRFNQYIEKGVKGCGELKVTYKWADSLIDEYVKVVSGLNIPLLFHMEAPRQQYIKLNNSKTEKLLEQLLNGALNGITKYYLTEVSNFFPFAARRITKGQKYFPGYLYDFAFLEKAVKKYW